MQLEGKRYDNPKCAVCTAPDDVAHPEDVLDEYIDMIKNNLITLCKGPAGTGKTYLAVAMAAAAIKKHEVEKIILTRPVMEAGEKLGFLPGDLQDKVDPYLRPLYHQSITFHQKNPL